MSDLERVVETSERSRGAKAAAFDFSRKALACGLAYLMIPMGIGDLFAQTAPPPPPDQGQYQQAPPPPDQDQYDQAPPAPDQNYDQGPPPQAYNALSTEQLDQLVAPIALYPDALVAQILAASTFPTQVADADHFVQQNAGAPPDQLGAMADQMNWDPSVKALVAFPRVLNNLDRNLDWTSQLGNAYYNQPQDVMAAVQDMRARAYAAGNLRSGQYYSVQYDPGDIVIAPVNPEVVYVPWYNPWAVYGAPVPMWGGYYVAPRPVGLYFAAGIGIGFGIGIAIGHWNHWGWGWHNWGMGWHDRTVVYQRNVYISNSVHVVNHGYYGHFDRNPQARVYNRTIYARNITRINNITRVNNVNRVNNFNRVHQYNRTNPVVRNNNQRPTFNRSNSTVTRPTYDNRSFGRTAPTSRPNTTYNTYRPQARPDNSYRPGNTSRPNNTYRPQPRSNENARPNNNYRPNYTYRPNNARPERNSARPQPQYHPQSHPEYHPESHPSGGHDNGRQGHRR